MWDCLWKHQIGVTYTKFVIRVPRRNELMAHLKANNIGSEIYYPVSLHQQECFSCLGYRANDFPASERAADETLALPVYPEMTHEMQRAVVQRVVEFYEGVS